MNLQPRENFLVNALAATVGRLRSMYAGVNGNTKRTKLWDEFGYPDTVSFELLHRAYRRNSAATAGVNETLDNCWSDYPTIIDGPLTNKSAVSTEWETIVTRMLKKHWSKIVDADRRNLIGRYSAIIMQFKDSRSWSEPVDTAVVARLGENALVKMIPVWESQIKPGNHDTDTLSPTYGQPVEYIFNEQPVGDDGTYGSVRSVTVHPSRVIILAEGSEDGNMLSGIPLNEAGYNDLLDLEKTKGGSAEGFLKNASRQLSIAFDSASELEHIDRMAKDAGYKDLGDAMNEKMTKMNRGTDAALVMQSGQASVLSVAVADPTPSWTVSGNCYAASIGCPFNILFGKQTGNLASEEDRKKWAKKGNGRRNGWLSFLIKEVIQRWCDTGLVAQPKEGEITVDWSDLLAPSDSEKLENMGKMAEVAQKTQQAYGTPAIEPNEVRAAGELEPLKEPAIPDPNKKITDKDSLTDDDDSDNPNRNANRTA